ncbi:MAG: DUF6671 family protein [Ilumatobacteraceae bacterium]
MHPYRGRTASLATRHGKLVAIAPAFCAPIGLEVVSVDVDTDSLGTFVGDRPRSGTQRETAIAKARLGMAESGLSLGLATEASFGPLDGNPFVNACLELVVLVDDDLGVVLAEHEVDYSVPAVRVTLRDSALDTIPLIAAGFPEHGLIVRPEEGYQPIFKGVHDYDELRDAVQACVEASPSAKVVVESDFRAHHSPARLQVIERAAHKLALRAAALCRQCGVPGWGVVARNAGAPCRECGDETRIVKTEVSGCAKCDATVERLLPESDGVDPRYCASCNP